MFRRIASAAFAAMVAVCPAQAQFQDSFDDYDLGSACGQGGWQGWDMVDFVCGEISDEQANSGSNSMKIIGADGAFGDDMIHQFEGFEGGAWTFSIMTYVPSDAQGRGWVILLNDYEDFQGGNNNWSLQVAFDADAGQVQDDPVNIIPPVDTLPLIFDEWVEFRAEIDLDADTVDYFYNDEKFVTAKSWVDGVSGGGVPIIDAIDLYGDEPGIGGTTGIYLDDLSIQPAGDACIADCDGNGVLNILDFVCYQGLFQSGDPAADCDANGVLNILDFVCFQGAFQAGCD